MKISLHRALARIKTTEKRLKELNLELESCRKKDKMLVDIYSNINGICTESGKNEEKTTKLIQGTYDKFNSLYDELVKLKRAVTISNSGVSPDAADGLNTVKVCGKDYTVAELIVLRNVILLKESWLRSVKFHYVNVVEEFNSRVEKNEARLQDQIKTCLGSDSKKWDENLVKGITERFKEDNGIHLVDPLNLSEKIEKLESEINEFKTEADAAFSEANALRTIDVDIVA